MLTTPFVHAYSFNVHAGDEEGASTSLQKLEMGKKDKERDKEGSGRSKHSEKEKRRKRHGSDSDNEGESREKRHKKHRHSKDEEDDYRSSKSSKRDSDRTKSKERSERSKERSKEDSKKRESEHESHKAKTDSRHEDNEDSPVVSKSAGGDVSLSIEETNKLRAQLGLKPLVVETAVTSQPPSQEEGAGGEEAAATLEADSSAIPAMKTVEVHAPPKNIGDAKLTEKLRDKMEVMRESREITKKLRTVKGLGEADEEESTAQWVIRMREIEKEKELAKKRAQILEEMDEEFGVSDLVDKAFTEERQSYTSQDLAGITVEHTQERFREGSSVVLTLKDTGVLEEGEDVLVNVLMKDHENAERNVKLKRDKSDYCPYEEEEMDEYGLPKTKTLLNKYDEEIEGVQKKTFTLSSGGSFDAQEEEREKERIKQRLQEGRVSLQKLPAVVASEYFTAEEMVAFRKPKKRRKVRKGKLKADDLIPLAERGDESQESKDHGKRIIEEENMEVDTKPGSSEFSLLDEADAQTDSALKRTRRLLQMKLKSTDPRGASRVSSMLAKVKAEAVESTGEGNNEAEPQIVLDTLSEFCRHLGEEKEEKPDKWKATEEDDETFDDVEAADEKMEEEGGWEAVQDDGTKKKRRLTEEDELYQEAEPVVSAGMTAALQMAVRKGLFEEEEDAKMRRLRESSSYVKVEGYNVGVRDADYERERKRERDRDRDGHLRDMPFPEKKDYIPEVKIEYVDNLGRCLAPKEAFRQMSHKFHGKGSGKRKTEKRLKRQQEEFFLNRSSIVDTPLQTVEMQRQKQESAQTPYIVLTGYHQNVHTADLSKTKRK